MKLTAEGIAAALHPLDQAHRLPVHGDSRSTELARPAAVLIPLEPYDDDWRVLLTVRTAHLTLHAGQVSFPGGQREPEDPDPVATALRETAEETAIEQNYVRPIGLLDAYRTITGYRVTPVVGILRPGYRLQAEPGEVDELFWMPLSLALDRNRYRRESVQVEGRRRDFFVQAYDGHRVWGATAAMLLNLAERLGA